MENQAPPSGRTYTEGTSNPRSIFNRMIDPQQIIPRQGQVQQPAFLNFKVPLGGNVPNSIATQIDIDSQLKSIGKQRTRCDT
jgi:hypothetical protein